MQQQQQQQHRRRLTVVLTWLVILAATSIVVVGATATTATTTSFASNDQYSPSQPLKRHQISQGPKAEWKDEKDLRKERSRIYLTIDIPRETEEEVAEKEKTKLRGWKKGIDKIKESPGRNSNSRILLDEKRRENLKDAFVADDTFQDQGPGSVEVYKLDLFESEPSTPVPTSPKKVTTFKSKSKHPKKVLNRRVSSKGGKEKWQNHNNSKLFNQETNSRNLDEFPPDIKVIETSNKERVFGVGGVPELQVGCEGLEAATAGDRAPPPSSSASSMRRRRSHDEPDGEVNTHFDYDLSDEETYEDELLKLEQDYDESNLKRHRSRGDIPVTEVPYGEIPIVLPERGDLGNYYKSLREANKTDTSISKVGHRGKRDALWGYGENEGALPSDDHEDPSYRSRNDGIKRRPEDEERIRHNRQRELEAGRNNLSPESDERRRIHDREERMREYQRYLAQRRDEELRRNQTKSGQAQDQQRRMREEDEEEERRRENERRAREYDDYLNKRREEQLRRNQTDSSRRGPGHRHGDDARRRHGDNQTAISWENGRNPEREREQQRRRHEEAARRREESRRNGEEEESLRRREEEARRRQESSERRDPWEDRRRLQGKDEDRRRYEEAKRRQESQRRSDPWESERQRQEEAERRQREQEEQLRRYHEEARRRQENNRTQSPWDLRRREEEEEQQQQQRQREAEQLRKRQEEARRRQETNQTRDPWGNHRDMQRPNDVEEQRRRYEESRRGQQGNPAQDPWNLRRNEERTRGNEREDERRAREYEEYLAKRREYELKMNQTLDVERRRQLEEKLQDYLKRIRPVTLRPRPGSADNWQESKRPQTVSNTSYNRDEEERRRMEEERKLQEYIRRNQPINITRPAYQPPRNWGDNRQPINRNEDRRGNRGPSSPMNVSPRVSYEENLRMEEARRREMERRRELQRREEERRRIESKRYEEERRRLELNRQEEEKRRKEVEENRRRQENERRRRPINGQNDRRLDEARRRQQNDLVPANLVQENQRRAEDERLRAQQRQQLPEEQRKKEERQRHEEEYRREQWRRREEARLNALPVSASIIIRSGDGRHPTSATPFEVKPRFGEDSDIDFPGLNPNRRGASAGRFPEPATARPPVPSPKPCVWAILQCCSPSDRRPTRCFASMKCPGATWDPDPCNRRIYNAATAEVMRYYEAINENNDITGRNF